MPVDSLVTAGLYLAAGMLLVAGVAKLHTPDGAMTALHRIGVPSGRVAARLLGLGEVAAGLVIMLAGGLVAAIVAALAYGTLTAVALALRSAQLDCGCFGGSAGSVMTLAHVAANVVFVVLGAVGLLWSPWSLAKLVTDAGVLGATAGLILLAVGTGLLITILALAADRTTAMNRSNTAARA